MNQPASTPTIPDYELIRRIGGGSYGDVWLARSTATGTLRAVKIVSRDKFDDDRPFQREFEGIQHFERISHGHQSQLALFHIGRNDAARCFYYVMELADAFEADAGCPIPEARSVQTQDCAANSPVGIRHPESSIEYPATGIPNPESYSPHTLRADLEKGRLPAAKVVEIGLALTEALGHLHRHGLVHRDVKPSNVIFVNGRPKLADIGLITDASDKCSVVGTEGYLPAEGPGTPQADVFALGKVLYEAATGLDRRTFPYLPPEMRSWPDVARVFELNEIVLKACSKESGQRYSGAESMLGELQRLSGGRSIRRARRVERGWRLARRGAAWLTAAAVVFALVLLAGRVRQPQIVQRGEKRSTNEAANILFDLGKTHFDIFKGTNFAVAADYFQRAIQADTNFAQAYGFLAAIYSWSDDDWNPGWKLLPHAKEMALQALELDDSLAEPHLALAVYHSLKEWAWSDAEKENGQALKLNPSSALCHLSYAEFLRVVGRTDEALKEMNEALARNESSRIINVRLIHYLVCARRFDDALTQIDKVVAMEAVRDADMVWDRRDIFLALGQIDKAIEAERDGRIAKGESKEKVEQDSARKKRAFPTEGLKLFWQPTLEWHEQHRNVYSEAQFHAQLGNTNAAFGCLEKLLKERDTGLTFGITTDWMLDPIRSDPRFHAILKRMHLE